MDVLKAGIIGASGYTGLELLRILSRHPDIELSILTSERYEGREIPSVFPSLKKIVNNKFEKNSLEAILKSCDIVFTALPHKSSMPVVSKLITAGKRVIDLSADYRIKDPLQYEEWYSVKHTSPELLTKAVYGIPELNREKIKSANMIANPGCYATSIILALAPIVNSGLIYNDSIIADSKSGISGAGRNRSVNYQYSECNESVRPYNIACHRHIPEIEQELNMIAGDDDVRMSFTPHLIPMTRGILSTIYCNLKKKKKKNELIELYTEFYREAAFIRIANEDNHVETKNTIGSNYCDIGVEVDVRNNRIILTSAIDNLVKGASGQAVQNMNIMCGFCEHTALDCIPVYP